MAIIEKWNEGEVVYKGIFGSNTSANKRDELYDFEPVGWDKKGEFVALNKKQTKELYEAGLITEVTVRSTNEAYDKEMQEFLSEYRKNQANRTQEEINEQRSEARAAMGSGVKMVNIITGEIYTT